MPRPVPTHGHSQVPRTLSLPSRLERLGGGRRSLVSLHGSLPPCARSWLFAAVEWFAEHERALEEEPCQNYVSSRYVRTMPEAVVGITGSLGVKHAFVLQYHEASMP